MKNILFTFFFSFLLLACSKNDKEATIEQMVSKKDITGLQQKKAALQAELTAIEGALAKLNKNIQDALVSVTTVKDTSFNSYLEIQGNVDTKENILIQPEFSGVLTSLLVKPGQKVSKGQLLGRVDDAGMSQQLASLENAYELAKTTFDRQKNLWDKKIGSEIQFLQAQTQMISAQKAVAQMKAQLAKTLIKAPFSGTIDEVFVEKGEVVAPSMNGLMRIVNLSNMYVSTTVPEGYLKTIKVGTTVEVFIASINKTYTGKVRQVGNFINPNNRSFGIEVSVPNADNLLRPNQVAKLSIIDYSNAKAIAVPSNVVQQDGEGNTYVYTVENISGNKGNAKKTIVKTGKTSKSMTEIIQGLSANMVIVTDGVNTISDGMKVNF